MTDHFNETAVIPEAVLHGTNSREALADVLSPAPSRSAPQQPVPDLLVQRALEQDLISNYLEEDDSTVMYRGLRQRISAE